jgi:hypothetical protein
MAEQSVGEGRVKEPDQDPRLQDARAEVAEYQERGFAA